MSQMPAIAPVPGSELSRALVFYVPPPNIPPNPLEAFMAGYLQVRTARAQAEWEQELRAKDPLARAQILLQLETLRRQEAMNMRNYHARMAEAQATGDATKMQAAALLLDAENRRVAEQTRLQIAGMEVQSNLDASIRLSDSTRALAKTKFDRLAGALKGGDPDDIRRALRDVALLSQRLDTPEQIAMTREVNILIANGADTDKLRQETRKEYIAQGGAAEETLRVTTPGVSKVATEVLDLVRRWGGLDESAAAAPPSQTSTSVGVGGSLGAAGAGAADDQSFINEILSLVPGPDQAYRAPEGSWSAEHPWGEGGAARPSNPGAAATTKPTRRAAAPRKSGSEASGLSQAELRQLRAGRAPRNTEPLEPKLPEVVVDAVRENVPQEEIDDLLNVLEEALASDIQFAPQRATDAEVLDAIHFKEP